MPAPIVMAGASVAAKKVGSAVGNWLGSYDKKKDANRQNTARTLYAAAMNGDSAARAQLRCYGALPLSAADIDALIKASGGTKDATSFGKCGFASPPAKALARSLALQLDSAPAFAGNAGNPATLGTSPMRVAANGDVLNGQVVSASDVQMAGVGGILVPLLLIGAVLTFVSKE